MICAVYARVSTEQQARGDSIKHQVEFFKDYALKNDYTISGIYIDEGVSGTKTDGREAFARLIQDAAQNKFDIVLVKSISRLARNLRIAVNTAYEFIENDIRLISIEDNIDTLRSDSKILLGIHATLAEQESEKISQRVKFGLKQKAKNGYYTGSYPPYGYKRKDKNSIAPAGDYTTAIAKRIFDMYIQGNGMRKIARILNDEGIPCPAVSRGADSCRLKWTDTSIRVILTNPVYIGCLEQCKTTTKSAISCKRLINADTVFTQDTHEGIVSVSQYNRVKEIMRQRRINKVGVQRHLFSRVLFCGECGYAMLHRPNGYICGGYARFGRKFCESHSIREDIIIKTLKTDLSQLLNGKINVPAISAEVRQKLHDSSIERVEASIKDAEHKMNELNRMLQNLLKLHLHNAIDEHQLMLQSSQITAQYLKLQKIIESLNVYYKTIIKYSGDMYSEIEDFLSLNCINPEIIKRLISRIIVYDDNCIEIYYNFTV